jgi:hypothetical protein
VCGHAAVDWLLRLPRAVNNRPSKPVEAADFGVSQRPNVAVLTPRAARLKKAGSLVCTIAFILIVLGVLLGLLGIVNEVLGISSRPRGYEAFVAFIFGATFVGGVIASTGLFLIYASEWEMHQQGFHYDVVAKAYRAPAAAEFPYAKRAAMLASCVFLHLPYLLHRWWSALPD